MITLKDTFGEAIILNVDGKEIIITLHDVSQGAAKLKVEADEEVKVSHKIIQNEFID